MIAQAVANTPDRPAKGFKVPAGADRFHEELLIMGTVEKARDGNRGTGIEILTGPTSLLVKRNHFVIIL